MDKRKRYPSDRLSESRLKNARCEDEIDSDDKTKQGSRSLLIWRPHPNQGFVPLLVLCQTLSFAAVVVAEALWKSRISSFMLFGAYTQTGLAWQHRIAIDAKRLP